MDKGLYQAPLGLDSIVPNGEPAFEIEIEDPESVKIGIGDIEIDLEPKKKTNEDFDANLAEQMSDKDLASLAGDLIFDFDKDKLIFVLLYILLKLLLCQHQKILQILIH